MSLRPHQHQIVEWILENDRCAVWAPMGSGKTAATLCALSIIKLTDEGPALVLAPKRVAQHTWPAEAAKWTEFGLTVVPILGSPAQRNKALCKSADVYTISYDNLPWLVDYYGSKPWPFTTVVADEATRLKSFRTRQGGKRARALGKVAHTAVRRFIELTGTPAPNGLVDLWGQLWFIDRGARLGHTFSAFSSRWFNTGYNGWGITPMPHAESEIHAHVNDVCVTIDIPFPVDKPVVTDVPVVLSPASMRYYRKLERDMFLLLESEAEITAVNAAVLTGKCQQFANGAVYVGERDWEGVHDEKLDALASIIEEANGAPVLVAYQFRSDAERIKRRFPQARLLTDGGCLIDDWNAGKVPLMLFHPASAGHGLNLQDGGNILVWFGLPWSLELYEQAIERIGPLRQLQSGYDRPCLVYRIVATGTIDELVAERLEGKRTVQEVLLDAMRRRADC